MNSIAFTVYGKPMPKGSKTAVVRGGKAILLDARRSRSRKEFRDWHGAIQEQAYAIMINRGTGPILGPIAVHLHFALPRPKSLPKKLVFHAKKPDIDKLCRAALDAMSGLIFYDDAQVATLCAEKEYGTPVRMEVEIRPIRKGDEP